jgi:site-specific DNA-adenine methylase
MRLRPFFSYYGAKWRAANYYPPPQRGLIIEPFAGSACYALRYPRRKILLIDKDPVIAALWEWLIEVPEREIAALPTKVDRLDEVDACDQAKSLIGFWLAKGSPRPVPRRYAWARTGNWDSQFWGAEIKDRIISQLRSIRHWECRCLDYLQVRNRDATWFVDPPYYGAGKHYSYNEVDYDRLGLWCKDRKGQVIVCEQAGASWLPFAHFRNMKSLRSRQSHEVYWLQGPQGAFTFMFGGEFEGCLI